MQSVVSKHLVVGNGLPSGVHKLPETDINRAAFMFDKTISYKVI